MQCQIREYPDHGKGESIGLLADSHERILQELLYLLTYCFCVISSQLIVNRSVFTAVDVSDQMSAPAGADTQVLFAPEG